MAILTKLSEERYRASHPLVLNEKDGSVLIEVPAGEYEMGDGADANCPKHKVLLDRYWIGIYCVTNRQYAKFVGETGHRAPDGMDNNKTLDHPVVNVSWDDAEAYAKWAGCRLPTEAQWEKGARGPLGLIYPWGNEWDQSKCRNDKNKGNEKTSLVWGYGKGASGYGSYNQSGNVWEWCADWYDKDYYTKNAGKNPTGPSTGSRRVYRGGCWYDVGASYFRGASRLLYDPSYRDVDLGFRLVRTS
jgi:formylglycine-generating enzyme